ncbi:MAG: hypothetical protein RIC95_01570 [Vicingaceae bacterium]
MRSIVYILVLLSSLWSCTYDNEEELFDEIDQQVNQNQNQDTSKAAISFQADVQPIIQANCATSGCHNAVTVAGGGNFTTYAGIKAKVDNGSFENRVIVRQDMPPSNKTPLSNSEIDLLKDWLEAGAPNN